VPHCKYGQKKYYYKAVFLAYAHKQYLKQVTENSKGKSKNIVKMNWTVVASSFLPMHCRSIGQDGRFLLKEKEANKCLTRESYLYNCGISRRSNLDFYAGCRFCSGSCRLFGLIAPFGDGANGGHCATHQ
jgi:hypothetical protein